MNGFPWKFYNAFNQFNQRAFDGTWDLNGDQFNMMLLDPSYFADNPFGPAQVKYSDISSHEITAAPGYTAGGVAVGPVFGGNFLLGFFYTNRATWTSTGSWPAFGYAAIYNFSDVTTPKGLVCFLQLDSPITINGDIFNIDGHGGDAVTPGIIFAMQYPGNSELFF